ncbi:hypothetical protein Mgra_00006753 [Meloidogyne graminicola]|uniref:Aquaporin n=1 Tax=Meloidogyne graminicola TaxID=189291 RepID=A0A8S9ZKS6_9BILA|nr:hypothetical protein Mgra_00006753 [Meloidogyne graminicola]
MTINNLTWRNNRRNKMSSNLLLSPIEHFRHSSLRIHNPLIINILSEFLGTFLLVLIGCSSIAQFVISEGKLNNHLQVCLAWGFAIFLSVSVTYKTSSGHLNPAVSLAICSLGKLSIFHYPFYVIAQTFGAFFGAFLCLHIYIDSFNKFDGGIRSIGGINGTGIIFCSFPQSHISLYSAFIDQVVGTGLLLLFVCAIIDPRNKIPNHLHPLFFGFIVFLITSSFGMNLGTPINPARDFGPRLFMLFAGYGLETFSWNNYYFWIPIIAPFIGALIGTWLYQFLVGIHILDENIKENKKDENDIKFNETDNLKLLPNI